MLSKGVKWPHDVLSRLWLILRQRETWLVLLTLAGITLLFWLLSEPLIYLLQQGDMVSNWINGFGLLAPLAYIALFALQILIAPMPGQFMGMMGGYVFGVFLGSLYSITGLAIGAGLAMFLARRYGRPFLERFFSRDELKVWERKLYMRSPVSWGLLFVFPVPDVVFYFAGLSSIPLVRLLPAVIAGRSLGLFFANIVGGLSATLPPEWVVVKWMVLAVLALLLYRHERKLRLYFLLGVRQWERTVHRWSRHRTTTPTIAKNSSE
jgi:uncharacterized membrane protein YdjX (TVP38/TMEM64 family)